MKCVPVLFPLCSFGGQEYLEMQRQLALQRLQEHEREMHVRLEQQKHLTQMRQMQTYGYPQGMVSSKVMNGQR